MLCLIDVATICRIYVFFDLRRVAMCLCIYLQSGNQENMVGGIFTLGKNAWRISDIINKKINKFVMVEEMEKYFSSCNAIINSGNRAFQ